MNEWSATNFFYWNMRKWCHLFTRFFTSWVLLKKINPLLETWNTWSNSFTFWGKYWKGYWQFFPHFAQNFFCCCHCFYFRFIFRFECKNVFLFFFHNNWLWKFRCKKLDFFAKFESAHKLYEFYSSFSALPALNIRD